MSEKVTAEPKPKRAYNRKAKIAAAPVPPPPVAPDPAVIALKGKIVEMVDQRDEAQKTVLIKQAVLATAQAELQFATQQVNRIEQDIQYRIGLIRQLNGEAPTTQMSIVPAVFNMAGISSEPTTRNQTANTGFSAEDGVNRSMAARAVL